MSDKRVDGNRQCCEYIVWWGEGQDAPLLCGAPATKRYPAMGGGLMHRCDQHSIKHPEYGEAVPDVESKPLSLSPVPALPDSEPITVEEARAVIESIHYLPDPRYEVWLRGINKLRHIAGMAPRPRPPAVPPHMPGKSNV